VPISGNSHFRFVFRCVAATMLFFAITPLCFPTTERYGVDVSGNPISDLGGPGIRIVVLIFAASDCPISNRYVPEIARLGQEFSGKGVRILWIYPNPADTAQLVSEHDRDFSIPNDLAVLDKRQSLVALAHATVTPESAVFVVDGKELREVYHGRIDDRYISLGQERPQPQRHDLEEAVAAALAGKPVPQPGGAAVGCSIVFLGR
jgi:hypothetical protein